MSALEWRRPRWLFTTLAAVLSGPANIAGFVIVLPAVQDPDFKLLEFLPIYSLLTALPCLIGTVIFLFHWSLRPPSEQTYASDILYTSAITTLFYSPILAIVVAGGRLKDIPGFVSGLTTSEVIIWLGVSGVAWVIGAVIWMPAVFFSQYVWRNIAFTR